MATAALIMWLTTVTIVGGFFVFFYKILTTKREADSDS